MVAQLANAVIAGRRLRSAAPPNTTVHSRPVRHRLGHINQPTDAADAGVRLAAGGRVDVEVAVPVDGRAVRFDFGAGVALVRPPAAPTPPAAEGPRRPGSQPSLPEQSRRMIPSNVATRGR